MTDLYNPTKENFFARFWLNTIGVFFTKVEQGAWNQLWAATIPKDKLQNGAYYNPVGVLSSPSMGTGYGRNEKMADQLWDWTEEELKNYGF